jgi:aconitate hydratase
LHHGAVVIAAITSCTNTSNPDVLIAAGLVARKARALGLTRKPWVKTSLAPGSKVVTEYSTRAASPRTSTRWASTPWATAARRASATPGRCPTEIEAAIKEGDLVVASVLSGNRNFEGRVHPNVKANYLASPPLVRRVRDRGQRRDRPLHRAHRHEQGRQARVPQGHLAHARRGPERQGDVPHARAVPQAIRQRLHGNPTWNKVPVSKSDLYKWNDVEHLHPEPALLRGTHREAHGSQADQGRQVPRLRRRQRDHRPHLPAGDIAEASPAGEYLKTLGVPKRDFNSYGTAAATTAS